MRRRDFLAEHIMDKSFVENVMRSIAWTTLCGAVFAMSISALKSGSYLQGSLVFAVFLALSTLAVMYVALHIVIPLDSAMYPNDPFWDEKAQQLKGVSKFTEAIKIFLTRKRLFYLILCMGYFLYANEVSKYLAEKI